MNDTENILQEQTRNLPPDVRRAILAVDLDVQLMKIANKHNLRTDEAGKLANETMLVMVGLEHPNDLVGNLARELKLPREAANGIAADVNEEIFLPIRASLMKMHERAPQPIAENKQPETETRIESREEILKEIEREASLPTQPPANLPMETPVVRTTAQSAPPPGAPAPATHEPETKILVPPVNPIERKLTEAVHIPREEAPNTQPKKTTDPYREQME